MELGAFPYSRGSSQPRDQTHVSCIPCVGRQTLLPLSHLGSPSGENVYIYTHMAEFLRCSSETITALLISYILIQNNKRKKNKMRVIAEPSSGLRRFQKILEDSVLSPEPGSREALTIHTWVSHWCGCCLADLPSPEVVAVAC